MRKLLAALCALSLVSSSALGAPFVKPRIDDSALTGTTLTGSTDITLGVSIAGALAVRVTVVAPSGATVTGGGVACYWMPKDFQVWTPCNAAFNATLPTGSRFAIVPDMQIAVPNGRLAFVPVGVTLSSGTTVKVYTEVSYR